MPGDDDRSLLRECIKHAGRLTTQLNDDREDLGKQSHPDPQVIGAGMAALMQTIEACQKLMEELERADGDSLPPSCRP